MIASVVFGLIYAIFNLPFEIALSQSVDTTALLDLLRSGLTCLLPVQGETQKYVVAFQPVLGVKFMQPLGDNRYVLIADLCAPE